MSSQQVLTIAQAALHILLITAAPILLVVLLVGLIVSILQAVTQINENTLSFIPKLVAAIVVLIFIGPWLVSTYVDYLREVLLSIPGLVGVSSFSVQ
jgi:flagellar biosynthesis protein FliQ